MESDASSNVPPRNVEGAVVAAARPPAPSFAASSRTGVSAYNTTTEASRQFPAFAACVLRVGEVFAEFGVDFPQYPNQPDTAIAAFGLTKWSLRVFSETNLDDPVVSEEISIKSPSKTVKVRPNCGYIVEVRLFSDTAASWSDVSPRIRTCSFAAVITSIVEIGEDYVRILWDRPQRDTSSIAVEKNVAATSAVASISGFELKVLREHDMVQEYTDEFPNGVRTYTLHELKPATAYVVLVRYKTLIGTLKQWTEACRFYTQAAHELTLSKRAEDTVSFQWARSLLPATTIGYILPDNTIHKYEIVIEGRGADSEPVQLAASTSEYTAENLTPSTQYKVKLRCLTKEGRWGTRTKPLCVTTADRVVASVAVLGETFMSISWLRPISEQDESKIEYIVKSATSSYTQQKVLPTGPNLTDKVFHISGLASSTEYVVTVRTFLLGAWGRWSEPLRVRTRQRAALVFLERGENFLTVNWPVEAEVTGTDDKQANAGALFNVVVSKIDSEGTHHAVLDEEVTRYTDHDGFRVERLLQDSRYEVRCRRWQRNPLTGYEGWGEFSNCIRAQTLQSVALQAIDVGEDFAQVSWRRGLSNQGPDQVQQPRWLDLKYEIVVGCLDSGEDRLLHREVLETTYTVSNLRPNTRYVVSVRACDEREQWGLWSKLYFTTLSAVKAGVHEIGEDYVRVTWERQNSSRRTGDITAGAGPGEPSPEQTSSALAAADTCVTKFTVFVFSNDSPKGPDVQHAESGYPKGGNAQVAIVDVVEPTLTSLRVGNLLPDRQYIAVVRAATASGKMGLWSAPVVFNTVPQLRIPVNTLNIGENYIHLHWGRDENPTVEKDVHLGNMAIMAQELRIFGIDNTSSYAKEVKLSAHPRELKLQGLSPATAYTIQLRSCNVFGEWGVWSPALNVLTRCTIATRTLEIAEDYCLLAWDRKKATNPNAYPTGKGFITSYHLRVQNKDGVQSETFLGDGDCPYRISGLEPDTFYLVELKAMYNDEEWGLWSTPLWTLTMKPMELKIHLISEEFVHVNIARPNQVKRLPEDDGNIMQEDRVIALGQPRTHCMLCVTSSTQSVAPHATAPRPRNGQSSMLPPDCLDQRIVYQVELTSDRTADITHAVANLRPNTIYRASVRSKLNAGEWGMWTAPSLRFATVPTISVGFTAVGENFATVEWKREQQATLPSQRVLCGLGIFTQSRLKIRDTNSAAQPIMYNVENSTQQLIVDGLDPAKTYAVSVQTFNDNRDWGVWSDESLVRTVPPISIQIQHCGEDAVWLQWSREIDESSVAMDTALNVDTLVKHYEIQIVGDGHFLYNRELKGQTVFFRGLIPDQVYTFAVRAMSQNGQWGIWASRMFRTLPTMRLTFGNIGEHFAVVEWRRHLPTAKAPQGCSDEDIVESSDVVLEYRLKVEQTGHDAVVYELSPNTSSFRLTELQPSAEYRVWMCAKGYQGVWGLWNQEARVRTLPQLALSITDIGEEYVNVQWVRKSWAGDCAASIDGVKVFEIHGAVSGYQLEIHDDTGRLVYSFNTPYTQQSYVIDRLALKMCYTVQVRARDTYNEWGLWSETRKFATLQPVKINLLRIGEDHVELEWNRRTRLAKRRVVEEVDEEDEDNNEEDNDGESGDEKHIGGSVSSLSHHELGSAGPPALVYSQDDFEEDVKRGNEDVLQWHVRVYPSKLFGGMPGADEHTDYTMSPASTHFRVKGLTWNTSYTIAVKAQNTAGKWGSWSETSSITTIPRLTTTVKYIGETFILFSWTRPDLEHSDHRPLGAFPPTLDIHNFQVQIRPLASETPFNNDDEPTVDGARVYETSQQHLQLSNLLPGVRYRIEVREQTRKEADGTTSFGVFSEMRVVETIEAMAVVPDEIGENYAAISWRRRKRSEDEQAISVTRSALKPTMYEIRAVRFDDLAEEIYRGPHNALSVVKTFPVNITSFHLPHLIPNAIYAIEVRAQTEGGYWGLWSHASKFITLKRLTMNIELINEDNVLVSWTRQLPDWAQEAVGGIPSSMVRDQDAMSGADEAQADPSTLHETEDSPRRSGPPPADTISESGTAALSLALQSVALGDYSVSLFEVYVEGISAEFTQTLCLPNSKNSTRVSGLNPGLLYTIRIRSRSEKEIWSLCSATVSFCTLKLLHCACDTYTENLAKISWEREPQNIADHSKILTKTQDTLKRDIDQQERKARSHLQQLRQEQESLQEQGMDQTAVIEQMGDVQRQLEEINDDVSYLSPDRVNIGKVDISAFQLRLYGDRGVPFITGSAHILPVKKRNRKKIVASQLSRQQSVIAATSGKKKRQTVMTVDHKADEDEGQAEAQPDDDRLLLDVKVNARTQKLDILGLEANTPYEYCVRGRNSFNEWGPWSTRLTITTLNLVTLDHTRFGEHYINLFWHRQSHAALEQQRQQEALVRKYTNEFSGVTADALRQMKATAPPEEYQAFVARFKDWRTQQRAVAAAKVKVEEGSGEVVTAPGSTIQGYHLRLIHENGSFRDCYIDEKHSGEAPSRQFTLSGLQPNTMYVVLLCADYGINEWGTWTEPLKFMTQNLIQLQITYVGESFIDIEWRRAPNKKLQKYDEGSVLVNPTAQGRGHTYEVSLKFTNPSTGEEVEELRPAKDCNVFRVDRLFTDSRYVVAVREWDPKSEWGLWSGSRSCVTLAGMRVTVHDIGEHWMNLSWLRVASATEVKTDSSLVLLPVDSLSFYLRVEELVDNGVVDPASDKALSHINSHLHPKGENEDDQGDAGSENSNDETDLHAMFDVHTPGIGDEDHSSGPLPPQQPPEECNPFEKGETRYVFIKKFSFEVTEIRLEDLRPDRFYSVQVLCETTGGQLGGWSVDTTVLTLSKIHIRADLLDEDCARLSWIRDPPRQHPRLKAFVITGDYRTESYELEAKGLERKCNDFFVTHKFPKNVQEFRLTELLLNSSYSVRVRSIDTQQRISMWGDSLNFATLKQLRVLAGRITENAIHVEWGRDPQLPSEYPETDTPIVFGQEKASQYHLRVFTPSERDVPFLDKILSGNHSRFTLSGLAPNASYIVQAQSCNLVAEWGMWSDERIVYTMPLIQPSILTVGEDYLLIQWERQKPTELQEIMQQVDLSLRSGVIDDEIDAIASDDYGTNNNTTLRSLQMKKRYPLLDKPALRSPVYCSARTKITHFSISVAKRGDVEGIAYEVPNTGKFTFRVDALRGDTPYAVTVRGCYGDDDWGLWSTSVNTATLNLLASECRFVGEDYLTAEWHRTSNSFPTTDLEMGKTEETLTYQFLLHDYTDVPIGEEGDINADQLVVRDTLVASRSTTIRNLRSNRRYRLSVRRWFRPITTPAVLPAEQADGERPLTEEQRLRDVMDRSGAMSGAWSEALYVITLKDMVVLVDDIAEDYLQVHWERDPQAANLPTRSSQRVVTIVQNYHVRLDQMTSDGAALDNSPGTLHLDQVFGSEDTNYRVPDIKADNVYKVDVRCLSDKVWGQWSSTIYIVALPKLEIDINGIGENYVSISWQRNIRQLTLPDGTKAISGSNAAVDKYQLDMCGIDHHFRLDKRFKASRTSYRVKHIDAAQLYSVCVRSCDVNTNAWSLWSDRILFATLKPLTLSLGKVGEQFVHVSWFREPQTREEYAAHDPNVRIGNADVSWYHLCVFGLEQSPATAIVDKQFAGDVLRYRVTTLAPNTSYIVIVRSCSGDDQWGLWSDERIVKTQRLLSVSITGIGENYLKVKFEREDGGDAVRDDAHDGKLAPQAIKSDPVLYHLALTSERDTIDKQFTIEDCVPSKDESKSPTITVTGLSSDTKYICALQPCYGNDEWGLWTKQLTFITLNKISVTASNVTESSVDLAWGRAQQSVEVASDPSVITWRSSISKYQLLMRKAEGANPLDVPDHIGMIVPSIPQLPEGPAAATAAAPGTVATLPPPAEGQLQQQPPSDPQSPMAGFSPGHGDMAGLSHAPSSLDERNLHTLGGSAVSGTLSGQSLSQSIPSAGLAQPGPTAAPAPAPALPPAPERRSDFLIEREMEVKGKYVQSTCSIDNLLINTDYLVQVRAMEDQGSWGSWTELIFDTPPPPPASLTLKKSGAQYVLLAWEAADAHRYQYVVEQAIARDAPPSAGAQAASARRRQEPLEWRVVDTVEDPSCRIRSFGPHNKIRCRVKCCKLEKETHIFSHYSEIASLSSSNPPEPVNNLALTMLSRQNAAIEWEKPIVLATAGSSTPPQDSLTPLPPKSFAYRVLLGIKDAPPILMATTRALNYIMNDLEPNTTYRVQVQVEGEGGLSQKNTILKFTTKLESDKTVSKHQQGQAPLGVIATRPGTSGGDDEARLPSIVHKPGTGVEARDRKNDSPTRRAASARNGKGLGGSTEDAQSKKTDPYGLLGGAKSRAESASHKATQGRKSPQKDKAVYKPQPPSQGQQRKADAAPRRGAPAQSGPKKTSPQKTRGQTSPARKPPQTNPDGTLPPLAVRRGAPPQGSGTAMEEYDVVGFSHSDDERN